MGGDAQYIDKHEPSRVQHLGEGMSGDTMKRKPGDQVFHRQTEIFLVSTFSSDVRIWIKTHE